MSLTLMYVTLGLVFSVLFGLASEKTLGQKWTFIHHLLMTLFWLPILIIALVKGKGEGSF
jgi:hypothetical protein